MKLKDIADMDDYLENRCYCPYEIYDLSGFFFNCFKPDVECDLLIEGERGEIHGTFVLCKPSQFNKDSLQIVYIEHRNGVVESCIRLGFDQHHKLKIHIVCKTKMFAEKLVETLKNGSYIMEETTTVILPELYHSKMDETYPQISSILETLFDAIPES